MIFALAFAVEHFFESVEESILFKWNQIEFFIFIPSLSMFGYGHNYTTINFVLKAEVKQSIF